MQEIQRFADEYMARPVEAPEAPQPAPDAVLVVEAPAAAPVEETAVQAAEVAVEAEATAPSETAPVPTPVEAVEEVAAVGEAEPTAELEEEVPVSLDELFALKPEVLEVTESTEEEEEESDSKRGKKGKKKKKHVEVVYDPDRDLMMVRKKHKRGGEGWDWE
jgi:hypothetical protein